ncbi:TonB-dependent receptor [Aurantiacibacter spongiae]|uniref:TonB-dependent siderophore receptor n=1 Tax=Aurantiacibacter spongiae TaxID=2488860 RepID=A0A3N5CWH9_9SPHN|nr:TonB-dependent siderophore receptor [Aurantiacibacter spongiae]RPF71910.1 TonB-dependent siderophore receptor [Aurantiacibacter spongiae]
MTFSALPFRPLLLSGAALAAFPATALADDQQAPRDYAPGNIVVTGQLDGYQADDGSTATKTDTPLIDVPQAVTVLTRDQLEDQNAHQLGEALRYVPGVSLESGEGHRDAVFIRGQSTTADFYLDGIRDDAQYYRSLYNVERVEVLKGPNALIFGRGAGGGAINRVSKTASTRDAFVGLSASVGTFGDFALATDVNQPLGDNVAGRLNATYEEFDNDRDFYEGRFIGISPTVTARFGPDTTLTASYTYDDDRRVTDRGLPSLNGRPLTGYDDVFFGDPDYNDSFARVHIARTRIDHRFGDAVSANATLQYANYDKFYANITPTSGTTATTTRLAGYESGTQRENLIGQANLIAEFATAGIGHTVLIGAEFAEQSTDANRGQVVFDNGETSVTVPLEETIFVPAFTTVPQRASKSDLATQSVYVQDQVDFGILQLIAGLRYDRFDLETVDLTGGFAGDRVDEGWSPRLGMIVKPFETLSLYASYSESFLPQSGDQFSLIDELEETLDPEEFENYEIGVKWAPRTNLLLSAAAFRLERSNTRAADPLNPGFTILAGESRVEGFEVNLAGEVLPALQVNLSYTYLDGKITQDTERAPAGTRLQQLPESQIGAWARYDLTDRLGVGAGIVHQSEQFASLGSNVILPGYTRVDAAVYLEATDRLALQLNVENLLDEDYYPSAHGTNNIQPGEPVNASIGARLRF